MSQGQGQCRTVPKVQAPEQLPCCPTSAGEPEAHHHGGELLRYAAATQYGPLRESQQVPTHGTKLACLPCPLRIDEDLTHGLKRSQSEKCLSRSTSRDAGQQDGEAPSPSARAGGSTQNHHRHTRLSVEISAASCVSDPLTTGGVGNLETATRRASALGLPFFGGSGRLRNSPQSIEPHARHSSGSQLATGSPRGGAGQPFPTSAQGPPQPQFSFGGFRRARTVEFPAMFANGDGDSSSSDDEGERTRLMLQR